MKRTSIKNGFLEEINSPDSFKKTLTSKACARCSDNIMDYYFDTKLGWLCTRCMIAELQLACENERIEKWQNSEIDEALSPNGSIPKKLAVIFSFFTLLHIVPEKGSNGALDNWIFLLLNNLFYHLENTHPLAKTIHSITYKTCMSLIRDLMPYILVLWKEEPPEYFNIICHLTANSQTDNHRIQGFLAIAAKSNIQGVKKIAYNFLTTKVSLTSYEKEIFSLEYAAENRSRLLPLYLLENIIRSYYKHGIIEVVYKRYIIRVKSLGRELPQGKVPRSVMYNAFAEILLKEESFRELMKLLPGKVKTLFEYITWDGGTYSVQSLEKEFKSKIYTKQRRYGIEDLSTIMDQDYMIIPVIPIILYDDNYYNAAMTDIYLGIPRDFADYLKKWLPVPREYNLLPLEKIPEKMSLFQDNGIILEKLNIIYNYLAQDGIQVTTQGKMSLNSLKKFLKATELAEFYDTEYKELMYARAKLLAGLLLQNTAGEIRNIDDPADFLKNLITDFFSFKNSEEFKTRDLLENLKAVPDELPGDKMNEKKVRSEFFNLLKSLQEGMWYALDDLFGYIKCRGINLNIINTDLQINHYIYAMRNEESWREIGQYRNYLNAINYPQLVILPLLKTLFALAASFGLIDMAYAFPGTKGKRTTEGKEIFVFGVLKYVRLTPLGAYIAGARQDPGTNVKRISAVLTLDDKRLYIHLDTSDPVKQMILDKLAEKVNDTCYKVTFHSFLSGCVAEADVENRITFFKNNIAADPPPVWQEFLAAVRSKIEPLVYMSKYAVFQLKENKELSALFANDKILSRYVLKAENYHILVAKDDFPKIRKRLEEFGYFLKSNAFSPPI